MFTDLSGVVLEISPGTGANLRYFAKPGIQWVGVEPNRFVELYLEKEAKRLGIQIELRTGQAHKLPVEDRRIGMTTTAAAKGLISKSNEEIAREHVQWLLEQQVNTAHVAVRVNYKTSVERR